MLTALRAMAMQTQEAMAAVEPGHDARLVAEEAFVAAVPSTPEQPARAGADWVTAR